MDLPGEGQPLSPPHPMAAPCVIDFPHPAAAEAHVRVALARAGWAGPAPRIAQLFADVARMFGGGWPGVQACDMRYHDLKHTLEATVCTARILCGQARADAGTESAPAFADIETGIAAALLHDTGFLKAAGDAAGTGAKYTFEHEARSVAFARAYLPTLGFSPEAVADAVAAIACTGPRNRISAHAFPRPAARNLACALVTADYLAQIAAADYPEKLDALHAEFAEACDHAGVPPEQRPFRDAADLRRRTPGFWAGYVRPMLDNEAGGRHRYLCDTGQPNPYFAAAEANIRTLRRLTNEASGRAATPDDPPTC